jgi:tripartite-type tricarboxylate transporter receptor subunit TctC
VPGFEMTTWFGLSAPAGVPRPVIDRLNREVGEMLRSPAMREKFASYYIEFMPSTPEAMTERIRSETPVWAKVMRSAGIEPE